MDESMKDDLRVILNTLYGEHNVKNWNMTENMAGILMEFLQAKKECNRLVGFVPMPYGVGANPIKYIGKSVLGRILKDLAGSKETIGCLNYDKAAYRSKFEGAGLGIY